MGFSHSNLKFQFFWTCPGLTSDTSDTEMGSFGCSAAWRHFGNWLSHSYHTIQQLIPLKKLGQLSPSTGGEPCCSHVFLPHVYMGIASELGDFSDTQQVFFSKRCIRGRAQKRKAWWWNVVAATLSRWSAGSPAHVPTLQEIVSGNAIQRDEVGVDLKLLDKNWVSLKKTWGNMMNHVFIAFNLFNTCKKTAKKIHGCWQ